MKLKGLFVTKIDKQTAINLFDNLIKEFNSSTTIFPYHGHVFCRLICHKLSDAIHNRNHFTKGIISRGLLTKTTLDTNKIVNIENFYTIIKNEIESLIISKCNQELMYCHQAKVLTGLRIGKEISNILNGTN